MHWIVIFVGTTSTKYHCTVLDEERDREVNKARTNSDLHSTRNMTGRKSRRGGTSPKKKRLFNHGCEHLREWCQRREKADRLLTEINSLASTSTSSSPCTVCVDCSLRASTPKALTAKHTRTSHAICFDRTRMQFFCTCCCDYTYMEEYEALSFAAGVGFRGELGALSERITEVVSDQVPYSEAVASEQNDEEIETGCETLQADAVREAGFEALEAADCHPAGLRGT